jgi:type IV pilus assembly protein PilQ
MKFMRMLAVGWIALICIGTAAAASSQLNSEHVHETDKALTVSLRTTGPCAHKEYRADQHTMLVDLIDAGADSSIQKLLESNSTLLKGYRLMSYTSASGAEVTRLSLELNDDVSVNVQEQSNGLDVVLTHLAMEAAVPASQVPAYAQPVGKSAAKSEAKAEAKAAPAPAAKPAAPAVTPVAAAALPAAKPAPVLQTVAARHEQTPALKPAVQRKPVESIEPPSEATLEPVNIPAPVVSGSTRTEAALTGVSYRHGRGSIDVSVNGPGWVHAFLLRQPDRLVMDFENTVVKTPTRKLNVSAKEVQQIRVSLFQLQPPVTRIVVDLNGPHAYQVLPAKGHVLVRIFTAYSTMPAPRERPNAEVTLTASAAPAAAPMPAPAPAERESPVSSEPVPAPQAAPAPEPVAATVQAAPAPEPAQKAVYVEEPAAAPQPATPAYARPVNQSAGAAPAVAASAPTVDTPAPAPAPQVEVAAAAPAPAPRAEPEAAPQPAPSTAQPRVLEAKLEIPQQVQQAPAPVAVPAPQPVVAPVPQTAPAPAPVAVQVAPAPAPVAVQPAAKYTGEPISVNLKDVDLKDFFRLIHEISGLNIVLDPSVHGAVTLVLDDVPWDQALDIVLKNNQLDRELQGNVLRIAASDTLRKEAVDRRAQSEALALAVDRQTITRFLSYAKAAQVAATLRKFLSPRGDIIQDDRTNAVIISDIPSVIPNLDALLAKLDRKSQEVEIEVRVVSATRSFSRDLGAQLGFNWGNGVTNLVGSNPGGSSSSTASSSSSASSSTSSTSTSTSNQSVSSIPLFTNFPAGGASTGISLSNITKAYGIDAILTAAETHNLAKVLSRPRVVTQSNVKAEVKQGVKIPVYTASTSTTNASVTYVDAVLRLSVTPQITADNTIFLQVEVENTQPSGQLNGNYVLTTQQASTQVLVTDGGTVVIGGVIQTTNSVSVQQTPLLGNIPWLGNLFKERKVSTETDELIFFISPKIIQT